MSIAKIKQELIDTGCDEAFVNLCFGDHTDIKDVTSAAQKLKFAAINKEEWDNSDKFALIAKELNERIDIRQDTKPQEKPDISNFTVLPTLQDDSVLMKDDEKISVPELLQKTVAQQTKIAKHGMLGTCGKIGLSIAAIIGMIIFALMASKSGAKPQKFDNQLAEVNNTFQKPTFSTMPKLPPMRHELMDLQPDQPSQYVQMDDIAWNRGVSEKSYLEIEHERDIKYIFSSQREKDLQQYARTGYNAALERFNGETFKDFAGKVFSKNKEFFGKFFVLDSDGTPQLNEAGNLKPKGDFKMDALYTELLKQAHIIDNPLDMAAIFARLPGTRDVCQKLENGELKLTQSQMQIGNGLINDLCAAYKIEPGAPLELGIANQQTEKVTKQRNSAIIGAVLVAIIWAVWDRVKPGRKLSIK